MKPKNWHISVLASGLGSLLLTYVFLYSHLFNRLHSYFNVFTVAWVLLVALLLSLRRLDANMNKVRLVVSSSLIGYASCTSAYLISVFFVNQGSIPALGLDAVMIFLVFPFFALGGWLFTIFLIIAILIIQKVVLLQNA